MSFTDMWYRLRETHRVRQILARIEQLSLNAKLIAVGCAVVVISVFVALLYTQQVETTENSLPITTETESSFSTTTIVQIVVHITGAVRQPGVYRISKGGRVADVITMANGPSENADINKLNLAQLVTDGMRIEVPTVGQVGSVNAAEGNDAANGSSLVDLNTATATQLEQLNGVGPATAKAIVTYREQHGPFRSADELLKVKGIGPGKLAQFRDSLLVQ